MQKTLIKKLGTLAVVAVMGFLGVACGVNPSSTSYQIPPGPNEVPFSGAYSVGNQQIDIEILNGDTSQWDLIGTTLTAAGPLGAPFSPWAGVDLYWYDTTVNLDFVFDAGSQPYLHRHPDPYVDPDIEVVYLRAITSSGFTMQHAGESHVNCHLTYLDYGNLGDLFTACESSAVVMVSFPVTQ